MSVSRSGVNSVDHHIGDRIRCRRQLLKMSITEAAVRLGVSESVFLEFESGELRIDAMTLLRLSGLMGVKVRYFYAGLTGAGALPALRRVND